MRVPGLLILAVWLPAAALAAGDATRGKDLFALCQGCHAVNGEGNPAQGAPRLAGQHGEYLRRQLRNFRAGVRGAHQDDGYGQLMSNFAKSLADDQAVEDVVAYIETLPR